MRTSGIAVFLVAAMASGAAAAHRDWDDDGRYGRGWERGRDGLHGARIEERCERRELRYGPPVAWVPAYREAAVYRPRPVYYAPPPAAYPRGGYERHGYYDGNRMLGQTLGAVVGGVIGNRMGDGRFGPTALGAVIGGAVGGELAEDR